MLEVSFHTKSVVFLSYVIIVLMVQIDTDERICHFNCWKRCNHCIKAQNLISLQFHGDLHGGYENFRLAKLVVVRSLLKLNLFEICLIRWIC